MKVIWLVCWRVPKANSRFNNSLGGLTRQHIVTLMAMTDYNKSYRAKPVKGKDTRVKPRGQGTQVPKSPLPGESHRTCWISPAMSRDNSILSLVKITNLFILWSFWRLKRILSKYSKVHRHPFIGRSRLHYSFLKQLHLHIILSDYDLTSPWLVLPFRRWISLRES